MNYGFLKEEQAVSTVVAAILILAVLTTFITAINTFYIPSVATDNEINHMEQVRNSFMEIASVASAGSSNEKVMIQLGSSGLPLVSTPPSSGSVTTDVKGSCISLYMENVSGLENKFNGTNKLQNLTEISVLYLVKDRLFSSDNATYKISLDTGNYMNVEIRDSTTVNIESVVNYKTIFKEDVAIPDCNSKYFSLDLLDPEYGFGEALGNTDGSFSLYLEGSFYMEYDKLPPYENNEIYPIGVNTVNTSIGSLKYSSSNNYWLDQDYVFENGAVILQQSTSKDSMVRSKPFIILSEDDQILDIRIFKLVGSEDSISGNGVSTINVQTAEHETYTYPYVENITISVGSDYCDAWERYFRTLGSAVTCGNNSVSTSFTNKSVRVGISEVKIAF
jgi:hypothetical protein